MLREETAVALTEDERSTLDDALLAEEYGFLDDVVAAVEAIIRTRLEALAVAVEKTRITRPMNGDGSSLAVDKVLKIIDATAGDDAPSTAARQWRRAADQRLEDRIREINAAELTAASPEPEQVPASEVGAGDGEVRA